MREISPARSPHIINVHHHVDRWLIMGVPHLNMGPCRRSTLQDNGAQIGLRHLQPTSLLFWFLLSVPAIQLGAPSCANGEPNRGTFLEGRHRLLEQRYAGTHRPFVGIRQHGSAQNRSSQAPPASVPTCSIYNSRSVNPVVASNIE